MNLIRQTWTLTKKNLLIVLVRHPFTTAIRAFLLPVAFMIFLTSARNLFGRNSYYGVGQSSPIRSLSTAMGIVKNDRNILALVNSGFVGGDIDKVIEQVAAPVRRDGGTVRLLQTPEELLDTCRSSLNAVSNCYGAAIFHSSPDEGDGGLWNYTLRADGALGLKIDTRGSRNDAELYGIPLQHAIDSAIASINATINSSALPDEVREYPFTSRNQQQNNEFVRDRYMNAIIKVFAVAFYVGMVGVIYHLVGFAALEREMGMSPLMEAMMPNVRRWQPQASRLASYHLAFGLIYAPGWLVMGLILAFGVFQETNKAITIITHLLVGLSLSSFAVFGASFFKKAQLSGISTTIVCLLLGIVGQIVSKGSNGTIAILGLLFPPMNYVFSLIFLARFEKRGLPANLVASAPDSPWKLPGIAFWVFFILQIFIYPLLGALIERSLYGTASKGKRNVLPQENATEPVRLINFTKHYPPSRFARLNTFKAKSKGTVVAVDSLSLVARKGQIIALLGANGSGKTTTLEAIAGLNDITSGVIEVDGTGGLGVCPQKNVLWDDLTVEEHIRIFNRLKSVGSRDTAGQIRQLIAACDLENKSKAKSKTLSGGQKRKLQLGMMFTGGSHVCCVDEVSSGLDPLSRRKIWDILLRERGARTLILTTHFLDEADLLADHIAILSKGKLKAEGSAAQLKHQLGGGYRVHVYHELGTQPALEATNFAKKLLPNQTIYFVPTSAEVAELVDNLEHQGIKDSLRVTGPSIEDVFLRLAEEVTDTDDIEKRRPTNLAEDESVIPDDIKPGSSKSGADQRIHLLPGKRIGMLRQAWVLFRKRQTIVRRNALPYCTALLIPVVAAGLVTLFLKNYRIPGCSSIENVTFSENQSFSSVEGPDIVLGPPSKVSLSSLSRFQNVLPVSTGATDPISLMQSIHMVDTLQAFNDQINQRFADISPGGFFLGDQDAPPTFAYQADAGLYSAVLMQNAFNNLLTNVSIATQYAAFDLPLELNTGNTLQLIVYFGLAMAAYPAFFALYPTFERLRDIRALHYSNGVRSLPLWLAYLTFDFCFVLAVSTIAVIIFAAANSTWYHLGYLFVVFILYGLASTTLAYVISLFSKSQLAAFAFCAGGQCVMFLLYFIGYMSVYTYAPPQKFDSYLKIVHFTVALITPSGNLTRAMFVALNSFSTDCRDKKLIPYPGEITLYGGPILYLTLQALILFGVLLWWDSGPTLKRFRKGYKSNDEEEKQSQEQEVADELHKVNSSSNGLRALHLTKAFGSTVAVEDITFGVAKGEVFALLGPNGAGKSTTISMIRGEIQPSSKESEIYVENISINRQRAAARAHMGVCPQFDAMDQMTAVEHLRFYARIRGVADVEHNVREVIKAVGLESFSTRMGAKLSGGNKRKLSLAIALMGNPTALLLDEPSSGMDAAAKRVMWKTLSSVVPGRSIVLTTHSMEEADALADRAGIMATRMLALGTTDYLRKKHGDAYYVHLVTRTAPHTSTEEMERLRSWVRANFSEANVEAKTYHGQMRFSVPTRIQSSEELIDDTRQSEDSIHPHEPLLQRSSISALFNLLEKHKDELGLEHYSVSQTTLDQVFLTIIGKHNIEEEDHARLQRKKSRFSTLRAIFFCF
ncbi:MAG: hypothetical protein M1816_003670 [Peltula sp. TS41687]|nr:MAG: hypothetical protein M1816_003670 [Peltula sp. TS41687]